MPSITGSAIVAETVEGSHVLKIQGYSRTKGLGNGKFFRSGVFDVGGHRWCLRYYPDGEGAENADQISIFLELHQTDATDVKAKIVLSLLDHVGEPVPSYSFTCAVVQFHAFSKEKARGFKSFIKRKILEESAYLKDDCFSVRCDVAVAMEVRTVAADLVVPPSNLHQHIGALLSSGAESADVTFEVGGETFAAHRLVLGARSPVLKAELFGPMKEKSTGAPVQIADIEPRVFKAMLHFIYTDSLPDDEMEKGDAADKLSMAQHLLVAADRYDLQRLKLICEGRLCSCISTSTAATTLALAEQHGCRGLKEACFKFLKSPGSLKTIMGSDGFQHLASSCPSLLSELLANVAP